MKFKELESVIENVLRITFQESKISLKRAIYTKGIAECGVWYFVFEGYNGINILSINQFISSIKFYGLRDTELLYEFYSYQDKDAYLILSEVNKNNIYNIAMEAPEYYRILRELKGLGLKHEEYYSKIKSEVTSDKKLKFKSIRDLLESIAIECQELENEIYDEDQPYDAFSDGRYVAMTNILNRFSKIIN